MEENIKDVGTKGRVQGEDDVIKWENQQGHCGKQQAVGLGKTDSYSTTPDLVWLWGRMTAMPSCLRHAAAHHLTDAQRKQCSLRRSTAWCAQWKWPTPLSASPAVGVPPGPLVKSFLWTQIQILFFFSYFGQTASHCCQRYCLSVISENKQLPAARLPNTWAKQAQKTKSSKIAPVGAVSVQYLQQLQNQHCPFIFIHKGKDHFSSRLFK